MDDDRLCYRCGEPKAPHSRSMCEVCLSKHRELQRRLVSERAANGLCRKCEAPVSDGLRTCVACRGKEMDRWRASLPRRAERMRETARLRYRRRRGDGVCVACQNPSRRFAYCKACRQQISARMRAARAEARRAA